MRFRLVLIVALAVVLGLTACGPTAATRSPEGGSSGNSGQAAEPAAPTAAAPVAASAGDVAQGKELYTATCSACHGPEGKGIQGLGKDLTTSEFIATQTDEQLLEFIKVGRRPDDPANTTGVDMPPKGGNPALTDEQIQDIIAYMRSIHQ